MFSNLNSNTSHCVLNVGLFVLLKTLYSEVNVVEKKITSSYSLKPLTKNLDMHGIGKQFGNLE